MKKKQNSYQKLKEQNKEMFRLYYRARKKLHNLGQGIEGDDIILDFDCNLPKNKRR